MGGFTDQQWIDRELAKVPDRTRRAFLAKMFSGEEGVERFFEMMLSRKGVDEFRDGTWAAKIPKYTPAQQAALKRPCVGCRFPIIKFTPWGELVDDWIPVCPNCRTTLTEATKKNGETKMSAANEKDIVARIEAHRNGMRQEIEGAKALLLEHLQKAGMLLNLLTAPEIGLSANELLNEAKIAELLKPFNTVSQPRIRETQTRTTRRQKEPKPAKGKKKKVRDWILEVLKGGKEMTRPEMEAEIKKQSGKKPSNLYTYVRKLKEAKLLVEPSEGVFKLK